MRQQPFPSEGRVAGKVAVVTGAASGIGRATAAALAAHGATVGCADSGTTQCLANVGNGAAAEAKGDRSLTSAEIVVHGNLQRAATGGCLWRYL